MKMLDFNAIQQPTWPVKLKDDDQTVVHLLTPSVGLLDRLTAAVPELQEVTKTKDGRVIREVYALIAEIMNCNEESFTFTADELREKYRLSLLDLFKFVAGYLEFVKEMQDAKN
jgi:hypothetical protein